MRTVVDRRSYQLLILKYRDEESQYNLLHSSEFLHGIRLSSSVFFQANLRYTEDHVLACFLLLIQVKRKRFLFM